jgi:hypothetical protein
MANLGRYCKAYPVARLREFNGWVENLQNLRADRVPANPDATPETGRLGDDDYLYLQENFSVTDGVFMDMNIVYECASPEWKEFCVNTLGFKAPDFDSADASPAD